MKVDFQAQDKSDSGDDEALAAPEEPLIKQAAVTPTSSMAKRMASKLLERVRKS